MEDNILLEICNIVRLPKVEYVVRYGTNEDAINEVVVAGRDESGSRAIKSIKMPSERLDKLKPYHKYNIFGERDAFTKHLFFKYLDSHPDERFFQALRNFSREHFGEFSFIGHSADGEKYKDTFYLECDELLHKTNEKIGE